mmetsp:Transcript_15018/g.34215  ORF Transcript_15018/g.34215 Transcript_15018/m.34215 type:complete len:196 (-) Transcript_15018:60-647(-)
MAAARSSPRCRTRLLLWSALAGVCCLSSEAFVGGSRLGRNAATQLTVQRRAETKKEKALTKEEKERGELEAQRQVFLALDEEQWGLETQNSKITSAVAEKVRKETEERMDSWWWQIGEQASRPAGIIVAFFLVLGLGYWTFATEAGQEAFYWSVQRERSAKMAALLDDEEFSMDFRNIDKATLKEIITAENAGKQ